MVDEVDLEAGRGLATAATTDDDNASQPSLSLYHESLMAFLYSNLIMGMPPLREFGRKDMLQGDAERLERLQNLPCTGADIRAVVQDNMELLTQKNGGILAKEARRVIYQQALGLPTEGNDTSQEVLGGHRYQDIVEDLEIVVLSDHRQQTDIVYMVAVCHLLKQVSVIFRGSTTPKDYKQDFKALLATIDNPIDAKHEYRNREEHLGMHLGFREYLYAEENITKVIYKPRLFKEFLRKMSCNQTGDISRHAAGRKAADELGASDPRAMQLLRKSGKIDLQAALELPYKYQIIIEQVLDIIEEHSDYRVFCTGHSLGASLATAVAFELAADERVPAPVSCINSGGLRVGNTGYMRAFTFLEKRGRLRCAQFSNNRDIIPKLPANGNLNIFAAACWPDRTLRHVGLQVEFCDKSKYVVHIPPQHDHWFLMFIHDFRRLFRFWGVVLVMVPSLLFMSALPCFCLCFWPIVAYCFYHHGKGFDIYHAQSAYLKRLTDCSEDLKRRTIEEFNIRRWIHRRKLLVHKYKKTGETTEGGRIK